MQPSQHDPSRTEQELTAFVVENFLFGSATARISADDSFLDKGIIDSTGILELVAFVEGRYQITVEDRELVPENLDSINQLVRFIRTKQQLPLA